MEAGRQGRLGGGEAGRDALEAGRQGDGEAGRRGERRGARGEDRSWETAFRGKRALQEKKTSEKDTRTV